MSAVGRQLGRRHHLRLIPTQDADDLQRSYGDAMTSAADIAAAIRRNLPGIGRNRLHKILYLAQGHHLAWFGHPLFDEAVMAWDNGPVVSTLWNDEQHQPVLRQSTCDLDNAQISTVGYVCSRYGGLSRVDLETLTKAQPPYIVASEGRRPQEAVRIDSAVMAAYFQTVDVDDDEPVIDAGWLRGVLDQAAARREEPAEPDDVDRILAKYGRPRRADDPGQVAGGA
jgi:uncharacterized phage-associated protein